MTIRVLGTVAVRAVTAHAFAMLPVQHMGIAALITLVHVELLPIRVLGTVAARAVTAHAGAILSAQQTEIVALITLVHAQAALRPAHAALAIHAIKKLQPRIAH